MNSIAKSFSDRLDNNDLLFVNDRLNDGMQDDIYEFTTFVEKYHKDIDKFLLAAKDSVEFFKCLDSIEDSVYQEIKKRDIRDLYE